MANTGSMAVRHLAAILAAADGMAAECAQLAWDEGEAPAPLTSAELSDVHAGADLLEKSTASVKYPTVHLYCERLVNSLKEKFRTFSGTAEIAIDIRVSHDHVRELRKRLEFYVDAITTVLHKRRGSWQDGMFYTGEYEVSYQPVKRGGKSFVQSAIVRLRVHMSVE